MVNRYDVMNGAFRVVIAAVFVIDLSGQLVTRSVQQHVEQLVFP